MLFAWATKELKLSKALNAKPAAIQVGAGMLLRNQPELCVRFLFSVAQRHNHLCLEYWNEAG